MRSWGVRLIGLAGLLLIAGTLLTAAEIPSPALLVLNKDENSLAIIDPGSRKVVARVPTGEVPHELVVSSDGKLAFTSNYGAQKPGNSISVIDLANQKELRRVDLGPLGRPHGLFFADGKLYFTSEASKNIGRYDPIENKIDWLLGTGQNGTHMVLISNDRNTIFTANIGSDTISLIERASGANGWNQTVIPVGKGPEAMDLSPDGKEFWAAHSRDGAVSVIDVGSKKVVQTIAVNTKRSNRLKFTPDGKTVLISDLGGGELVVVDAAARKEIKRIAVGKNPEGILIVPDGSRAYVAISGDKNLAIMDLKTLQVTDRIPTGGSPDGMAWAERK